LMLPYCTATLVSSRCDYGVVLAAARGCPGLHQRTAVEEVPQRHAGSATGRESRCIPGRIDPPRSQNGRQRMLPRRRSSSGGGRGARRDREDAVRRRGCGNPRTAAVDRRVSGTGGRCRGGVAQGFGGRDAPRRSRGSGTPPALRQCERPTLAPTGSKAQPLEHDARCSEQLDGGT